MYTRTINIPDVIEFIKNRYYKNVPDMLYDRYLWFYNDIEQLSHDMIYGKLKEPYNLYTDYINGKINSAAFIKKTNNEYTLSIASSCDKNIKNLLDIVKNDMKILDVGSIKIVASSKNVMEKICIINSSKYKEGMVKFYTKNIIKINNPLSREMSSNDEYLLNKLPKKIWGGYKMMIEAGYRFFGIVENDMLISMCALCKLNAFQSQIIGIETFDESDKRNGYGKSVGSIAVNIGLSNSNVVTWSTQLTNKASCQTAKSLGFVPYFKNYITDMNL